MSNLSPRPYDPMTIVTSMSAVSETSTHYNMISPAGSYASDHSQQFYSSPSNDSMGRSIYAASPEGIQFPSDLSKSRSVERRSRDLRRECVASAKATALMNKTIGGGETLNTSHISHIGSSRSSRSNGYSLSSSHSRSDISDYSSVYGAAPLTAPMTATMPALKYRASPSPSGLDRSRSHNNPPAPISPARSTSSSSHKKPVAKRSRDIRRECVAAAKVKALMGESVTEHSANRSQERLAETTRKVQIIQAEEEFETIADYKYEMDLEREEDAMQKALSMLNVEAMINVC